jgi:hypothetical protein
MITTMFGLCPAGAGAVAGCCACAECRSGDERTATQQQIPAFQICAGWLRVGLWNLILTHDVILFLVIHLKPTWLAEVSIGSA